jgi:hypothetical protein
MKRNDREITKRLVLRVLPLMVLLFGYSSAAVGQALESDEWGNVAVPDQVMEQVVRRVLARNFKPTKQKKIIYLEGKGLQQSWLPKIEGIEFRYCLSLRWRISRAKAACAPSLLPLIKSRREYIALGWQPAPRVTVQRQRIGISVSRSEELGSGSLTSNSAWAAEMNSSGTSLTPKSNRSMAGSVGDLRLEEVGTFPNDTPPSELMEMAKRRKAKEISK